ncbi:MAG: hypothetical protein OXN27_18995 [Candidatus Poribacteria bacterium]|nr:hypothetical protein [Candidatus Poribacteria bacterium]
MPTIIARAPADMANADRVGKGVQDPAQHLHRCAILQRDRESGVGHSRDVHLT